MRGAFPATAVALALLATTAGADDDCVTRDDALVLGAGGTTYYLWTEPCQPSCLYSVWVFEESNGVDGLQLARDNDARHSPPDAATA